MDVDESLLRRALTHRSFAYENGGIPHNERQEFLGDAVLGLVVALVGMFVGLGTWPRRRRDAVSPVTRSGSMHP